MTEAGTQFYIYRSRQAAVELVSAEFEQWKEAHQRAMMACDADDWAEECIRAGENVVKDSQRAFASLRENKLRCDPDAFGKALGTLIDSTLHFFFVVGEVIDFIKARGYQLDNEGGFRDRYTALLEARKRFVEVWPKRDASLWQTTAEEIIRGDFHFTEDVLHALQAGNPEGD